MKYVHCDGRAWESIRMHLYDQYSKAAVLVFSSIKPNYYDSAQGHIIFNKNGL